MTLPLGEQSTMLQMRERLIALGVDGVDRWLKVLERYREGSDQFEDILAQGPFAREFATRGLAVEMNPMGKRGPDLLLPALSTYVEVLRLPPRETDLPLESPGDTLEAYGAENASETITAVIAKKLSQGQNLPNGSSYLVAVRSDSTTFEDIEIEGAVSDMMEEAAGRGATYSWLGGVLFNDDWFRGREVTGWILWENTNANQPLPGAIRNSLDARLL